MEYNVISIGNIRIVPVWTCKGTFWRIQEIVTKEGHYIVWDGLFEKLESAVREVENAIHAKVSIEKG